MHYHNASKYMTREQLSRMGQISQKVQALRKLAEADRCDIPVRSGLQLGCIVLDFRTPVLEDHSILLFDAGYQNRYRYMLDMEKQDGLIGWHDATRTLTQQIRPLLSL